MNCVGLVSLLCYLCKFFFFFKQKTAYEMRISDWSSDVCSSDLVEMKRQGTNDQRALEGKGKQSQGNAIERLGKNLIGFRSALQYERITPFVCFGWGIDFAPGSSILDRVITMNEFYPL